MAYHDGELSWWRRWRIERRLRQSAALRDELAELESLTQWVRGIDSAAPTIETPDLWSEIGPALSQIDREVGGAPSPATSNAAETERHGFGSNWNWGSLAATGAVAMLLLVVLVEIDPAIIGSRGSQLETGNAVDNEHVIAEHSALGVEPGGSSGSLRYLQTNGVSYVVSQDSEDVTIIWLMDEVGDFVEGA